MIRRQILRVVLALAPNSSLTRRYAPRPETLAELVAMLDSWERPLIDVDIILSASTRPWNPKKISLVSAALIKIFGGNYSHASVAMNDYVVAMTSRGLQVSTREDFHARSIRTLTVDTVQIPASHAKSIIESGLRYDTSAVVRAICCAAQLLPYPRPAPLVWPAVTCCSFTLLFKIAPSASQPRPLPNRYCTPPEICSLSDS